MGSQNSSTNSLNKKKSNNKNKKSNQEMNQSQIYFNDSSSYKGVKTDTTSLNGNSLSGNSSISDKNNENNNSNISEQKNNIKIPTLFQWKEGGNNIIITGSFCGWSHRFNMMKNEQNNYYELMLYLPKGEYQFKFIVDNIWKCSNFYPTVTDLNNNTNNILDNTKELNYILKEKEKEKEGENQNTANSSINDNNNNNSNRKKSYKNATINLNDEIRKNYCNLYPLKEQLNSEPPNLPQYYINSINLNNYSNIGEKKFIYNKMNNNLIRETFQSVKIPNHVYLNHIFSNCKEDKNYNRNCTSFRIRSKFATIIYIHPYQKDFI